MEDESKGKGSSNGLQWADEDCSYYAKAAKVALKKLNKSETENAVVVDQLKVARKGIKKLKTDLSSSVDKFIKSKNCNHS